MADETTREQWLTGGDVPLLKAIADGTIPKPLCASWKEWQKWRKNPYGGRRATKMLGSSRPSTNAEESKLWQEVMDSLYGAVWLSVMHGQEEENEEEELIPGSPVQAVGEVRQVPPCTGSEQLPPGLEQEPPCSVASGLPPLPPPKTPPPSKRSSTPQRVAAATLSRDGSLAGSGGTGIELLPFQPKKRLEASPAQRAKEAQSGNQWAAPLDATTMRSNLRSHRGLGFLEPVSARPTLKPIPAFPEAKKADSPRLGRTSSAPNLPVQEDADADPSPLMTTWMICRCCVHTNHAEDD